MDTISDQVRGLASGTLERLCGLPGGDVGAVRAAFVGYVDAAEERLPGTFRTWTEAWLAFKRSPAYPLVRSRAA